MSYILSALRKAEGERRSSGAADIVPATYPEEGTDTPRSRHPLLIAVLSALLAACLVYLAVILLDDRAEVAVVATPMPTPPVVAPVSETPPTPPRPQETSPPASPPAITASSAETTTPVAPRELPPLPALNITGYIFFEADPARSKLFVDGIVYRLDSRLADGLILTGFGANHITVSHHGREQRLAVP